MQPRRGLINDSLNCRPRTGRGAHLHHTAIRNRVGPARGVMTPHKCAARSVFQTPGLGLQKLTLHFYQLPTFSIDAHGSEASRGSPFWSSSTLMPSGLFTNAIFPSLGGLLITIPFACRDSQSA